ncbi:biotin--[acetyl-CoA-carboxylase] ligase [Oscillibacter sp.]|uniref:biotin--[acetyl-CoA-carboxylase] ligase n=1 Tax=Oscillibacter sp. TaxID=1945593 RepID=UPI0028A78F07|nr:biotin--[acetyl-CoA-carboxylase] ligase [Oscillibacter sp.]
MSRQKILELLRSRPEDYFSGEEAAERLGMSRAAVWKAVDALRKEGYTVEARTGLGYRLLFAPDALTEKEIRGFLGETKLVGRELMCLDSVDSTNTFLKKQALSGAAEGTVVTADCQTGGRGRMDRPFQNPGGKLVALSVLLRPQGVPMTRLGCVTAQTAVALCGAVEEVCGIRPGIKWTNDLVIGRKKLCGILTEMALEGESGNLQYLVIGMGINVHQTEADFGPELREIAVSLDMALGKAVSRPALAAAEIRALDRLYGDILRGDTDWYLDTYRRDCVTLGKPVQLISSDGARETARALDIDDEFGLVVELEDGTRKTVRTGEVSVRGMYGYVD